MRNKDKKTHGKRPETISPYRILQIQRSIVDSFFLTHITGFYIGCGSGDWNSHGKSFIVRSRELLFILRCVLDDCHTGRSSQGPV